MEKTNRDKVADIHPKAKQKLDSRNTKLDEGSQFSENIFNTVREPLLVSCQVNKVGYNRFSLILASSVENCQSTFDF